MNDATLTKAFAIPEEWYNDVDTFAGSLPVQASCTFIPVSLNKMKDGQLSEFILKSLQESPDVKNVLIILPHRFAKGTRVHFWPDIILNARGRYIVTAVHFANNQQEAITLIKECLITTRKYTATVNASCQYQPPYTQTFNNWVTEGAKRFHPGDYFHDEFVQAIKSMKGHWLYWGHSDHTRLRGYDHINSLDLKSAAPANPLLSTIWFSCATIDPNHVDSIALEWFLQKSSLCLIAGIQKMNTHDNQKLAASWLQACMHLTNPTLSDIIHYLLTAPDDNLIPILRNYRILGSLWINFSISPKNQNIEFTGTSSQEVSNGAL